jgi:hypothetical protein
VAANSVKKNLIKCFQVKNNNMAKKKKKEVEKIIDKKAIKLAKLKKHK